MTTEIVVVVLVVVHVLRSTRRHPVFVAVRPLVRRAIRVAVASALFVAVGVTVATGPTEAAVIRPFATRFTMNTTGAIVMTGNTLLTCPATAAGCLGARTGTGSTTGANNNNSYTMGFVDIDGDPSTFDSSRNTLVIPSSATVAWAGLYWGADTTAGTNGSGAISPTARGAVLLRTPSSGAYLAVTATQVDTSPVTGGVRYQGFADVTALVVAGRSGEYTVANVQAGRGQDRYAGWALVVAYQDPEEPVRNLTVFDGYAVVQQSPTSDQNVAVPVSGFVTPPTGAVRSRVGVVAYEGDLGLTGDSLRLNSTPLSDARNPAANFFNSSQSRLGSTNTTGDPFQTNMLGFDIDTVEVTGGLANSATSATINLNTNNDTYFPGVVTFSTELYAPRLDVAKSGVDLNGGTLDTGDTVRYTMQVTNGGADSAAAAVLEDVIPADTTYVPGSLRIDGVSVSDAAGDDSGELAASPDRVIARLGNGATASAGGRIPIGASRLVSFDVIVGLVPANAAVVNTATVSYRGGTSGLPLNGVSNSVFLATRQRSDLSVLKSGPSAPVTVPGSFGYRVDVVNRGPATEPSARIVDTLPTAFAAGSATPTQGTCVIDGGSNTVTCDLGPIEVGGTVSIDIQGAVTSGSGSITNTVRVSGVNLDLLPNNDVAHAVVALDRPPVAVDRSVATPSGTPVSIDVLAGASDPDGDPLIVASAGPATAGSVLVNVDGTVVYAPTPGFKGVDSFPATISDGQGGSATITVTVTVANAVPVAFDDAVATLPDTAIAIAVLANDSDANADPLQVVSVTAPASGTAVVNIGGTVTYAPNPGFKGVDTFMYTIFDGTDTATATVTVVVPDAAPVAIDDTATTATGTAIVIDVTANDLDDNGDALSITGVTSPADGTATIDVGGTITYTPNAGFKGDDVFTYTITAGTATATATVVVTVRNAAPIANGEATTTAPSTPVVVDVLANDSDPNGDALVVVDIASPANGSVLANPDGSVTYTPNDGFKGDDSFTYTISDGTDTASATVVVTVPNSPPVGAADQRVTGTDTPVTIPVLVNDFDPNGDALTVLPTLAVGPSHGIAIVNVGDGTITYTPNAGFAGLDSFVYSLSDGADAATARVTIRVLNGPPVATDDVATTAPGSPVTIPVLANDFDPNGDALSILLVGTPANGTVTANADGTVTYAPNPGFIGIDGVDYTISDGVDTAIGTITVTVVNTVPVARDDSAATPVDTAVIVDVLANDTDADGDALTVQSISSPADGTASINVDGTVTYTPDPGFKGTDTFTYVAFDGRDTAVATVTIVVPDAAPVAIDDAVSTPYASAVVIDVLANDLDDNGEALAVVAVGIPGSGTAGIQPGGLSVLYTPDPGFVGVDTFTYTITDGTLTAVARVTVTVTGAPPVANDDSAATASETPVAIDVLANDSDANGDTLSVIGLTAPAHGLATIGAGGLVTYTPAPGFSGVDSFTYTITDGSTTSTATVTVDVANASPVAVDDTATTAAGVAVRIRVLANDADDNGDVLRVTEVTQPANGSVSVRAGGSVVYRPNPGFSGTDAFTYTVGDGIATAVATVTVIVSPPATSPPSTTAPTTAPPPSTAPTTAPTTTLAPAPPTTARVSPSPTTIAAVPTLPTAGTDTVSSASTVPVARPLPHTGADSSRLAFVAMLASIGGALLLLTAKRGSRSDLERE